MTNTPVLVIKRHKKGNHGHHGGAWKVAYADFVTAMMAFFLLLWLLNSVSDEQLIGISNYFSPISPPSASGGGGSVLSGRTIADPRPTKEVMAEPTEIAVTEPDEDDIREDAIYDSAGEQELSEDDLNEILAEREQEQLQQAARQLREAIESSPELSMLASHILVANVPEGLHIQIMDQEGLPMFPRGGAEMHEHTRELLRLVAAVIGRMPQDVAITGHTDSTPFATDEGYGNWELSADRANAARRELVEFDVPEGRIKRVVGKAATDPLIKGDPAAPANRRLSVVLLRATAQAH